MATKNNPLLKNLENKEKYDVLEHDELQSNPLAKRSFNSNLGE